ncbi:hypothetical protein ANAPC1_00180 [Anaplasma phagocytophilum]|uniref:Uncharacterized protein n=1 Tax=Anaplasma phagocytophilum TaxID=948 RepID=A0AA45ZH21_ANAPH|nr:hypothetical protein [Anaplasma phagocytophilum]SBO13842.1 hypothetical protein ANAPC1_00180 [Anaplasma phagocytophilum]
MQPSRDSPPRQEVRKSGSQEVRKSGSQEVRKSGSQEVRKSGSQEVRKSGSQEVYHLVSRYIQKFSVYNREINSMLPLPNCSIN